MTSYGNREKTEMASTENLSGRTGTVDLHDGEKTAVTGEGISENTTIINTTDVQYKRSTCSNLPVVT